MKSYTILLREIFERTTYHFLQERKIHKGNAHQSLNIKGYVTQHKVSRRYGCAACRPLHVLKILQIKKIPNLADNICKIQDLAGKIWKIQDFAHMYTREIRKSYHQHFVFVSVYSLQPLVYRSQTGITPPHEGPGGGGAGRATLFYRAPVDMEKKFP